MIAFAESFARGKPAPPGVRDPLICVGVQPSFFLAVEGGCGLGAWGSGVGLDVWGLGVRVWGSEAGYAGPSASWRPAHLDEGWGFIGHAAQLG